MRSRALALILVAAALAAFGGAAFLVRISEQRIASVRVRAHAFDAAVREVTSSVAEFDADRTASSLATLRAVSVGENTRSALDQAATAATSFTDIAPVLEQLNVAQSAEQQSFVREEATLRKNEAVALASAAAFAAVVMLLLAIVRPKRQQVEVETIAEAATTAPPTSPEQPAGATLRVISELCTNLGRVSDVEELQVLIGQTADLMDAQGLIVWINVPGATELRAALSHGYSREMVSRLPPLSRSADNAVARAFRTGQLQIVLSRPGMSAGAVVAPLLTSAGCVGAISAEVRSGGEATDTVQALAAIVAAQMANVLHATPQSHQSRATGTGGP
jgi:hypothetical protein